MGKVHGSLAQAGKVRSNTPKVAKQEKKKEARGRAAMRKLFNRTLLNAVEGVKSKHGPNYQGI